MYFVEDAVIWTLREMLYDEFTTAINESWEVFFNYCIYVHMDHGKAKLL